ncbi:MAG: serpin family protein [Planctomycetes bacterium]|nr:serpin family protein [Planctomycetota bacterium]
MSLLRVRVGLVALGLGAVAACTLPGGKLLPPRESASRDAKVASDGLTAFSADLYGHLRAKDGNVIVSPYSISAALAMTASGAQGNTRAELEQVLHLPPGAKVGPAYRAMADGTTADSWLGVGKLTAKQSELRVANSLWLQQGDSWKKDFLAVARDDFGAMLSGHDFVRDAEGGRKRINSWVSGQTRDHIKELVPQGALDANTRLVLANAIYFKANWATQFKKEETRADDFALAGGQKVKAALMHQTGAFWLEERAGFQVLRLPYAGGATAMYVLLPWANEELAALEPKLTAQNLAMWTYPTTKPLEDVKVSLPKFKFAVPTDLLAVLQTMGVRDAFDPARANFAGMTDRAAGLHVTRVIHKAFIETDEAGTEAAASTAVVMSLRSTPQVKEFRADRPFLFVIKHEATGAILFMGRVSDPTK